MKVDRTSIVGVITALRIWLEKDERVEFEGWKAKAKWIADDLRTAKGVSSSEVVVDRRKRYAQARLTIKEGEKAAQGAVINLRKGNPSIWVNYIAPDKIGIEPALLRDGEEKTLVSAIEKVLAG